MLRPKFVTLLLGTVFMLAACGGDDHKSAGTDGPESACDDRKDNDGDGAADCDDLDCRIAGSACALAPPVDRSVASTVSEAASFLYSGPDPLQKGADAKAFDRRRVAMLRGRVVDRAGEPLAGVRVSVASRPESGYTLTRPDGLFDLAVNGGARLVVEYEKEGFLSAERVTEPAWQRYARLPETGLIEASENRTTVASGAQSSQSLVGDRVEDGFGPRQPFVIFEPGTTATAVLPNGSKEKLDRITVAVTEYPFEQASPEAWTPTARFAPGTLPSANGLHYGLEFDVEEVKELGAKRVHFSTPVVIYVENFLRLPVGSPVPLGYYDRTTAGWQRGHAGRVVKVLEVREGRAVLDTDGDGEPEAESVLRELGVSETELAEIGGRYEAGTTLWRARVEHFSPWDMLFPVSAPSRATAPPAVTFSRPLDVPSRRSGAVVEKRASTRAIPITGTPFFLQYQSDRTAAYQQGYRIEVPVLTTTVPEGLLSVASIVDIAGQRFEQVFEPKPNQTHVIQWNGRDAFDRLLQGPQKATVTLVNLFAGALALGDSFGAPGADAVDPSQTSAGPVLAALTTQYEQTVGAWDAAGYGLGGFALDALHAYDPAHKTVFFGWGDQRSAQNIALVTTRPAERQNLGTPDSVAPAPDGSVIVTDDQEFIDGTRKRILRVGLDGQVTEVAGPGAPGEAGALAIGSPQGLAVKGDGTVIVSDFTARTVFAVHPDGSVETLISASAAAAPSVVADLDDLEGIALGPREELYIANGDKVFRLEAGELSVFAGGGIAEEAVPATQAQLVQASGIAVAPDGSVFISDRGSDKVAGGHKVHKVTPDGILRTVAGTGVPGFSGDGGTARGAQLHAPRGLALGPDGTLYIAEFLNNRVRRVTADGIIETIAGGGDSIKNGQLAENAFLDSPDGLALGKDGALFIATKLDLFRVAPGLPNLSVDDSLIPSTDGRTIYRFDTRGRHKATINATTGVTSSTFEYGERGRIQAVRDKNGLVTKIERNSAGEPTSIVAPFGQRTRLELGEGVLKSVTDDLGRRTNFEYVDGLLARVTDAQGGETRFEYHSTLLASVADPSGYAETFADVSETSREAVSVTTSEGRTFEYALASKPGDVLEQTIQLPDGGRLELSDSITRRTERAPDGTTTRTLFHPDPAFGAQSLFPGLTTVTTPNGRTLEIASERFKELSDADNTLSVTTWNELVDINGRFFENAYFREDRTFATLSPAGRATGEKYDELGQAVEFFEPATGTVLRKYDQSGLVERITRRAGRNERTQAYTYGVQGLPERTENNLGQATSYERDAIGRLLGITRPDETRIDWELDDNDKLLSLTPPGREPHAFLYQGPSDLLVADLPPAIRGATPANRAIGEVHYEYDRDRMLTKIARSDAKDIELGYDRRSGQLKSLSFEEASIGYTYDAAGKVSSVNRSDSVRVDLEHDGPLLTRSSWSGAIEGSVSADYDENFFVASLTVNKASTVSFGYDDDGLLVSATGNRQTLSIDRDAESGLVTGTVLGNVHTTRGHTGFGELEVLSASVQDARVFSQEIERDGLGRIERITETIAGDRHESRFAYDRVGRLTSADADGTFTEYAYDDNGNRTSVTVDGVELASAEYDAQDRILRHGEQEYTQSPHGDLLRRTDGTVALELTYDALGNLLLVSGSDGTAGVSIEYMVDGLGRRIARRVDGRFDRAWLYRDALRPVAEIDSTGVLSHFVYASDDSAPDFILRQGVPLRVIKDHLGSVRLVINATTGAIEQRLRYDAFGRVLEDTRPGFQPFGFAGGLYDPVTKLVRFGRRDYDPGMGRWTAKDPIRFGGGDANVYAYCGNDPLNRVDPDGQRPLFPSERRFLKKYFGNSLDTGSIDVSPTMFVDYPWSPYGNQIFLPSRYFVNGDPSLLIDLSNLTLAAHFAHEAVHVWQRQHGTWTTTEALPQHALDFAGILDAYSYDPLGNSADLFIQFRMGGVEQQADIFEDFVRADISGNLAERSRFRLVEWFVKSGGR